MPDETDCFLVELSAVGLAELGVAVRSVVIAVSGMYPYVAAVLRSIIGRPPTALPRKVGEYMDHMGCIPNPANEPKGSTDPGVGPGTEAAPALCCCSMACIVDSCTTPSSP